MLCSPSMGKGKPITSAKATNRKQMRWKQVRIMVRSFNRSSCRKVKTQTKRRCAGNVVSLPRFSESFGCLTHILMSASDAVDGSHPPASRCQNGGLGTTGK